MTVIDIYSGFLGAGKTTLIKKMISEAYQGQKLVLIENEFGEIGIDGGFLKEAGIQITEMNSGCICCSLVGDFGAALKQVIHDYHPDRILIEPSGVGKLSDVMVAVQKAAEHEAVLGATVAVADASKVKLYMKNFGEFYNNQIETAGCSIVLSRTQNVPEAKLKAAVELIRQHNDHATLVTTPWDELTGEQLKEAMEANPTLADMMRELIEAHEREEAEHEAEHHHHHHHHDEHDGEEHEHHHHHHDDEEEHEHHHHDHDEDEHHHHDHDEDEHEHHHHYDENGVCECGHHHGEDEEHEHHHHHHHADEVFTSWGRETTKQYTEQEIRNALGQLDNALEYGIILRAKGIVPAADGRWIHFDHVPGEIDVRFGPADVIGKLCVIGSKIDKQAIAELFGL